MYARLSEIHERTRYLNDFDLPHGKNLMPFPLKGVPMWFFRHSIQEIRIRLNGYFRRKRNVKIFVFYKSLKFRKIDSKVMGSSKRSEKYFACRPHSRAGFGHQIATVLAGLEMASKNDLIFSISGLTSDWEKELGLELPRNLSEVQIHKRISLYPMYVESPDEYTNLALSVMSKKFDKPVLFYGPFDDSKVDLTFGGEILQRRYLEANSADRPGSGKLAIHVRRARVGDTGYEDEYRSLSLDYYYEKFLQIAESSLFVDQISEIVVLGTKLEDLEHLKRMLSKSTDREVFTTMGCCDIGAFRLLATSDVMMGSKSGFSYAAGLVNPGTIFFPKDFWHTAPSHWIPY